MGEEWVKDQVTVRKHTADTKGKIVFGMAKALSWKTAASNQKCICLLVFHLV